MTRRRGAQLWLMVTMVSVALFAAGGLVDGCGKSGGSSSTPTPTPTSTPGGVSGVAHIVHGPSVPASFALTGPSFVGLTDGTWYVSPNSVQVLVNRINFKGQTGTTDTGADLASCLITFDSSAPSLSNLLDCPFSIAPGTYVGMTVFVSGTAQVLVSDGVHGIYTDPAAASGLTTVAPAAGAAAVPYVRPLGGSGVEALFATPLVVGTADTIALAVVLDAVQTLHVTVSGGGTALAFQDLNQFPLNVFPTIGAAGKARYFTSANTSGNYNDSVVLANILRVYFAAGSNGQPAYAFPEQTAGAMNGCTLPAPAYAADPATSNLGAGPRGGWLARDGAGTICWAASRDTWATYEAYLNFPNVTVLGSSGTLICEHTTTPPPPTSGSTYEAGCPAISVTQTVPLMLVAD